MPKPKTNETRDQDGIGRPTLHPTWEDTHGRNLPVYNIYQFTASNPTGQTEMWNTTENWISKQKKGRIIMHGDLNSAHSGCQWNYAQPLNKDIGTEDNKL